VDISSSTCFSNLRVWFFAREYLGNGYLRSVAEKPGIKQKIRYIQTITLGSVLGIVKHILDAINETLSLENSDTSTTVKEPLDQLAAVAGIICMILGQYVEMLQQYRTYSVGPLESLSEVGLPVFM
jgi:hypothetical protein